ncbi:MAG TPA: thermonuclease family protein [Candidatus Thiothrix moscowensis]|uniref:thermonuclease family protein n=1 Tax=unclassified Thiothrix TaxID=2636184 RepID=UPI0025D72DD9|nr:MULTISPECIES: thermonuclease family protein [unclassified Thiothrix]HRJ52255.1 thermonuclease family protein [Candidatus Thiothrix moscowensis]HRJ92570.1 thermonuclease family protein [Candidatus Thiothrix moscowensis]
MLTKLVWITFLCLTLFTDSGVADQLQGEIVGVTDGDTATLLTTDKAQVKIRLAQIDAPEKKQDFGQRSKQSLSDLVYRKNVTVDVVDTDRYGRTVGQIWVDGLDVNLEQIKQGMAWVYLKYMTDPTYQEAEAIARKNGIGLWQQEDAVAPWEWRKQQKTLRQEKQE